MSRTVILVAALAALLPLSGWAQPWIASRIASGAACEQAEGPLVSLYVQQRDAGVPAEKLLSMFSTRPAGNATRAESSARVFDVYLDRALDAQTIRAFRTAKCGRELGARDYQPFADLTRARLMHCQSLGRPGSRDLSQCIHALLDDLEDERQQRDGGE